MNPDSIPPEVNRRSGVDLAMLVLLALACLVARLPSIDRVGLNPDESQFESSAAYLLATGESAFALPYGTPWTMSLYKGIAAVFGPYAMAEVRILVLLIALGTAWLLYDLVGRVAGRGWGLLAGLLFLLVNQAFEGWTANREWFSFFPAFVGICLAFRAAGSPTHRRSWVVWIVAGLICGMSLWFKRQASFLVLVVPVWLLWRGWFEGKLRARMRELLPFAVGGILSGAVFLLPFVIHGTAETYVGSLFEDYALYIGENEAQTQERGGGALGLYAGQLFWRLPHRPLFLLGYVFTGVTLVGCLFRRQRPTGESDGGERRSAMVLVALYLVAALGCIKLGNRFFGHYFLYAIVPLSAAVALAGSGLYRLAGGVRGRLIALGVSLLLLIERALGMGGLLRSAGKGSDGFSPVDILYVIVILALVGFAARRPLRRAGFLLAALVVVQSAVAVVGELGREVPPSFPHHRDGFRELAQRISSDAAPGDRLFVWGWVPEIYSAVRLEPASHMTITEYVVDDYYVTPREPRIVEPMATMLMENLRDRKPRFIVDASARSWTMVFDQDPWLYRLDLYPQFELGRMLREEYRRVGSYSGVQLYERL